MSEEKEKPKPLIPVLTEREQKIASENKAWLLEVQDHNDDQFMSWPQGEGLTLGSMDRAYGFYPHRYTHPIYFHDSQFKSKAYLASHDSCFEMYHKDFDFDMKGPKKEKTIESFDDVLARIRARHVQGSTQKVADDKTTTRTIGVNLKPAFEAS
jgi:hypothetical protein